jgi:class 3 adenylate cyclase
MPNKFIVSTRTMKEHSEHGSSTPSDDDESCGHHLDANRDDKEQERATLAHKENKVVVWMKGAVAIVLLTTSVLVSTGVFLYTRNDQRGDFKDSFRADADRLLESFYKSVERTLEAVDALSVTITSHALETNSTFPNVSLPDFALRFGNARILSGSPYVEYLPLVTDETRIGYEEYYRKNAALQYQREYEKEVIARTFQDQHFGRTTNEASVSWAGESDVISNRGRGGEMVPAPPNTGPYLPLAHISPVMPTFPNCNVVSIPFLGIGFMAAIHSGQAVIDLATNLDPAQNFDSAALLTIILSQTQYRYHVNEYLGDPTSSFAYPVFDSFDVVNRKVVGVLGTMLYWRLYFQDVLPPGNRGIICVLENTKNQTFTYQIDDKVTYLGIGDQHDSKYDHLVQTGDVASYIAKKASPESTSFTSVALNTDYTNYKVHLYPSSITKAQHVNHDPLKVAMLIVSVFVFTSLVFVLYTIAVAQRQRVVMDRAVASSAIVSSLFPSQVRDKVYQENEAELQKNWRLADGLSKLDAGGSQNATNDGVTRPIAEVFQHTTVLFADLVGFTAWSAKRDPVAVFELLETLYKAFDAIAVRLKVFKVETIGDCYVAVTGLPDPQENHSVIMARFADECIKRMSQLVSDLARSLGEDTAKLEMRVGLHSGPVTGGVLRGQKSRFQLFGDTMNTASRMESNGVRGRIHCSNETANELIAKGKSKWVTPRLDKIVAKGKGEMQTFWVNPGSKAHSQVDSFVGSGYSSDSDNEKRTVEL